MGITLVTFGGLFERLQQFVGWLTSAPERGGLRHQPVQAAVLPPHRPPRSLRPLRVVRVVDACHAPASAGRMMISGRMADVCAELDRLAALEGERI